MHDYAFAQLALHYRQVAKIALGLPNKWDYVHFDGKLHRVYIAHGTQITVVNSQSGQVIGRITGIAGAHGVATDAELDLGFADNGKTGNVTIFKLSTLKKVGDIPADKDSDAMAYDPTNHLLIVANGDANDASLIDVKARRRLVNIPLGGSPEGVVLDGIGYAYINIASAREVVRIDVTHKVISARWPIPQCVSPHGLAIDPENHRLFISCENSKLEVVDTNDGHIVASLPIGNGTDTAVFDAGRKLIFSSNKDGTLSVIKEKSPNDFVVLKNVHTAIGARTMAEDPESGRVFVVSADVAKIDPLGDGVTTFRLNFVPGTVKLLVFDMSP